MITELRYQVRDTVRPLAEKCGLSVLPEFADIVVFAWLFFTALQVGISPAISRVVFPVSYGKANKRTRKNWDVHVVSLVHALIAVALASWCLKAKSLNDDRAFGTYPDASFLLAIAVGYFIWDALESIIHFSEVGFVVHGKQSTTFLRPFVHYYAVRFLLWEASTIFLNINWFLDKMGKTGSQLQFVNGIALLTSFFCVRLVWGGKMSYSFFVTLNGVYTQVPLVYIMVYGVSNLTLHALNWFWFMKMIGALRRRFAGKSVKNGNGTSKIEN
ncbi:DUF887-domain-containing protein [Boletus edulis BED1]|uniref:DUF887-domain-containing protein n=1 Tax=Boletus edulis BED1 TaxID=1328754 RepID=A0AAD4GJ06_BOLED|nr:DUF887-domain-containing protein [Boletus edulis BED1]